MHHKFCVFDNRYVLTGTWNPTNRGTNVNDNYIMFIASQKMAARFLQEYAFIVSGEVQPEPLFLHLVEQPIQLYFCPTHHCETRVLSALSKANESIQVLAFSFTSKPIAELLVNKSLAGVNVSVVFEKTRITRYSQYEYLSANGVSVFKDTNKYTMHEKLFIIDNNTVIAGSYNPTQSATTRNEENILIIQDKELAQEFIREFTRILNLAKQ
ncbi:hypothetical protein K9M74_00510 [Candidatus Woesearchaeota archaeon]|nr:hypothetical protein [Candidatus Woesearchaeota archaeon]